MGQPQQRENISQPTGKRHISFAKLDGPTKEIWTGVFLLIIFLLIFYGCTTITAKISDGVVSARFFPYLIAGTGSGLSLLLIISNLLKKSILKNNAKESTESAEKPAIKIKWNMIALSVIFMTVYLLLMDVLGFIVDSALYLLVQILVLEKDKSLKRIVMIVIISILTPVVIYVPFRYIFSLWMPLGIFK